MGLEDEEEDEDDDDDDVVKSPSPSPSEDANHGKCTFYRVFCQQKLFIHVIPWSSADWLCRSTTSTNTHMCHGQATWLILGYCHPTIMNGILNRMGMF